MMLGYLWTRVERDPGCFPSDPGCFPGVPGLGLVLGDLLLDEGELLREVVDPLLAVVHVHPGRLSSKETHVAAVGIRNEPKE